jgi:hypothetical protein
MGRPSRCSLHQGKFTFGEHPRKPTILFCDGLGSNIVIQYSVGPIIILHGRITAREYMDMLGNQVHPMIQMLFLNNDAVFQRQQCPHLHSWNCSQFEEHEGKLQHLPQPAQSLVLKTSVRNRFPPPTSLQQLENVPSRRMV